jgi:hypothetical protein
MTPANVADAVQWMVKTGAFMYKDLDLKASQFSFQGI